MEYLEAEFSSISHVLEGIIIITQSHCYCGRLDIIRRQLLRSSNIHLDSHHLIRENMIRAVVATVYLIMMVNL